MSMLKAPPGPTPGGTWTSTVSMRGICCCSFRTSFACAFFLGSKRGFADFIPSELRLFGVISPGSRRMSIEFCLYRTIASPSISDPALLARWRLKTGLETRPSFATTLSISIASWSSFTVSVVRAPPVYRRIMSFVVPYRASDLVRCARNGLGAFLTHFSRIVSISLRLIALASHFFGSLKS